MSRTCLDCAALISRRSKGRCRRCAARRVNADPAIAERRNAGLRAAFKSPAVRQAAAERGRKALAAWSSTPEGQARLRELGREVHLKSRTPEARAKRLAVAKAAGQKKTQTCLGWCPPEWRPRYQSLRAWKGAAEARRMVEAEIAASLVVMTPFERQLEAVRRGAGLVERKPLPRSDYAMTLGGVASGIGL